MTGWAGLSGSAVLASRFAPELAGKLPAWLLEAPSKLLRGDALPPGAVCSVPIGEGGVLAALWTLADLARGSLGWPETGLVVSMDAIPIRQETIEICEVLEADPYQIPSGGSLVLLEEGRQGSGTVIGCLTKDKKRIIRGREGIRYLNRPRCKKE